jgi:hypothetical protein
VSLRTTRAGSAGGALPDFGLAVLDPHVEYLVVDAELVALSGLRGRFRL